MWFKGSFMFYFESNKTSHLRNSWKVSQNASSILFSYQEDIRTSFSISPALNATQLLNTNLQFLLVETIGGSLWFTPPKSQPMKGSQGKNSRQEAETMEVHCSPVRSSWLAQFDSKTAFPGMALPTVDLALPHRSSIKKIPYRLVYCQSEGTFSQLRLPLLRKLELPPSS